ncbi:glycogen debranching protein [mine drainage metagenome]|uniref:Glycogen debranching protein n=3 Tax=mine drainage metagenome TaxID=410659 RepID=T0YKG2_9ZZZZ
MGKGDNEKAIDAWVLQGSGSKLDLKAPSLVKGKRAHLILRQDGNLNAGHSSRVRSGLWTGGFQHFSSFNLAVMSGQQSCKKYVRRPWYIYRDYEGLSRIDFVPPDAMSACIALESNGQKEIVLSLVISHSLMWPSNSKAASYTFDASRNGEARVGSDLGDTYLKVTGASASFSFTGETLTARIVMNGIAFLSIGGDVNFDPAAMFQQAENYYATVAQNCVLQSSSPTLDKAFFWSKIAILESYSETEIGSGFFAGFPEFSWFLAGMAFGHRSQHIS